MEVLPFPLFSNHRKTKAEYISIKTSEKNSSCKIKLRFLNYISVLTYESSSKHGYSLKMLAYPVTLSRRSCLLCASVSWMSFFKCCLFLDGPFFHSSEISFRWRSTSSVEMECWLEVEIKGRKLRLLRLGVVVLQDDSDDKCSPKLFVFWRCRLWRILWLSDWLKAFCTHFKA